MKSSQTKSLKPSGKIVYICICINICAIICIFIHIIYIYISGIWFDFHSACNGATKAAKPAAVATSGVRRTISTSGSNSEMKIWPDPESKYYYTRTVITCYNPQNKESPQRAKNDRPRNVFFRHGDTNPKFKAPETWKNAGLRQIWSVNPRRNWIIAIFLTRPLKR